MLAYRCVFNWGWRGYQGTDTFLFFFLTLAVGLRVTDSHRNNGSKPVDTTRTNNDCLHSNGCEIHRVGGLVALVGLGTNQEQMTFPPFLFARPPIVKSAACQSRYSLTRWLNTYDQISHPLLMTNPRKKEEEKGTTLFFFNLGFNKDVI